MWLCPEINFHQIESNTFGRPMGALPAASDSVCDLPTVRGCGRCAPAYAFRGFLVCAIT
jgi:hypothetical protein